jgi:hypothetical protein
MFKTVQFDVVLPVKMRKIDTKKYLISVKYQVKQRLDCKVNGQKINGSCKNRKKSAYKFTLMKFAVDKFRHEKTCINI